MDRLEGLPVIDVDKGEDIQVAVRADDLIEGNMDDPEQHPIAIELRRQRDIDEARTTKNETLVRLGKILLCSRNRPLSLNATRMSIPSSSVTESHRCRG